MFALCCQDLLLGDSQKCMLCMNYSRRGISSSCYRAWITLCCAVQVVKADVLPFQLAAAIVQGLKKVLSCYLCKVEDL